MIKIIYLLILAFGGIVFVDLPKLIKKRLWGELVVFSFLLTIGFLLSMFQLIGIKIPSPNDGIIYIIETLRKLIKT